MAEEHHQHHEHHLGEKFQECEPTTVMTTEEATVETTDRGLFSFMGKKEEEKKPCEDEVIVTEFEKVHVSEPEFKAEEPKEEEQEKKHSLLEKLHRSDSSSSSSDEENGEKKKKKKEKKSLKEKILGEKKEEDTSVPIEKCEEVEPLPQVEEKKGFLDKIKEKLPGGHNKKVEEVPHPPPPPPPPAADCGDVETHGHEGETKEKKGFLEKIKEKLPGYHPKAEEEKKEKEEERPSY